MKDFKELELQELYWTQTGAWNRHAELRSADDEVIARMTRPHWWSSNAEIDMPGNRWSLERRGIFRREIIVKSLGTGEQVAHFAYQGRGGLLTLADGRMLRWKQSNFWGTQWAWITLEDEPLMGFEQKGILRFRGEMSLSPEVDELASPALLMFLGWYLITLHNEDAAAVVAAT